MKSFEYSNTSTKKISSSPENFIVLRTFPAPPPSCTLLYMGKPFCLRRPKKKRPSADRRHGFSAASARPRSKGIALPHPFLFRTPLFSAPTPAAANPSASSRPSEPPSFFRHRPADPRPQHPPSRQALPPPAFRSQSSKSSFRIIRSLPFGTNPQNRFSRCRKQRK